MRILATNKGANAVYMAIAELSGYKAGTEEGKLAYGQQCYLDSKLLDLDYSQESDRSDAHENIWLQRFYDDLDKYYSLDDKPTLSGIFKRRGMTYLESRINTNHKWSVPVECDASASMLQYIGALLGDKRLLTMTNCAGTELSDPWNQAGLNRTMFKHAATPLLYGSSRACYELWQDWGHDYSLADVQAFNDALAGPLGLANAFKDFLISNVKPSAKMRVKIWNEEFTIECNRYRNVGEETLLYDIYDTQTKSIRRLHHTRTRREPDLDQFRRYFVTLLIHNLDSQVGNLVMSKVMDKYNWGIDIHDAFLVNPEAVDDVKTWYAEALTSIYENRQQILSDYFTSISISYECQTSWNAVKDLVEPIEGFVCRKTALK